MLLVNIVLDNVFVLSVSLRKFHYIKPIFRNETSSLQKDNKFKPVLQKVFAKDPHGAFFEANPRKNTQV